MNLYYQRNTPKSVTSPSLRRTTTRCIKLLAGLVLPLCLLITTWSASPCRATPLAMKVGFVFDGPVGDGGWNYAHELARLKLRETFTNLETISVANVAPEDAIRIIENLIQQGATAVFATNESFSDAVESLAGQHPDTTFFLCEGRCRGPNIVTYCGKIYQPAYLSGILAARMSDKKHLAFLGGSATPANLRLLNAFALGAQSADPSIVIEADWYTPTNISPTADQLAMELIHKGVDVYFNGIHSAQPMQWAMNHKIDVIGFATDLSPFASGQLLTSAAFDWSGLYMKFIHELKQGTLAPGHRCEGLKSGTTILGRLSPAVPDEVAAHIREREKALRSGRLKVFSGPIYDTDNRLRIIKGASATAHQLKNMDWAVRGVTEHHLSSAAKEEKFKIYIVQSYENDHVCGIPQEKGIRAVLEKHFGKAVDIRSHYMNTKTLNSSPARMRADAARAIAKIQHFKPDLVYTLDDNAFREVGLKLVAKPYPVVFSGINKQPQEYNRSTRFLDPQGRPSRNITGVYEQLHLQTALNVMQEIQPDLRQVVALLDGTPTGQAIRKQLLHEIPEGDGHPRLTIRTVTTVTDYLREIKHINADPAVQAVYPVVLSIKDEQHRSIGFRDTLRIFLQNCRKPGIPVNFAFAKLGLFGGASVDFAAMGEQAGNMGVQLLQYKDIRQVPVESARKAVITFNTARAKMLGINIPDNMLASALVFTDMLCFDAPSAAISPVKE
ncbi:ABC transporter, periplasmic substrate-binding protein [Syntrophotalea carbinolica DSM 2380]|uniref:ABC transporter, periplasmic substrate-binding protein n=1 Tax=Syntrophotalea carbinolica (strain DSM 2380 / NBRC 103641 / GraBd1) TaxID=338963 RepID=Q3A5Q0_SYNC1|nr:ABC transporter substrate binding protein [Syntrophotalea carbinolica]ABA88307.1 ABC transporter, periplasmic substrate-binding protein [Syntrophotalea carbinolica DSM 2380]